jgi:quercetin dioxygenase-like cupin family protein
MADKDELPEFLREAMTEDPTLDVEPVLRLPELLGRETSPQGLERLMRVVSEPPDRYAPFVERLSGLWDVPEDEAWRVLERSRDLRAFRRTPLPGVRLIDLAGGPKTSGLRVSLVRFAPGLRFPRHRHPGREVTFVLQGSYTDSSGLYVGPGEIHEMSTGTEHAFEVGADEPCVAAVVQVSIEFTHPVLRLIGKLFRP